MLKPKKEVDYLKTWLFNIVVFCFLLVLTLSGYAGGDPSLVLYLPMDENIGKVAYDLSKFKNDASFEGSPKWAPGKFNSCIDFSSGNYLKVQDSDSLDLTKGLTIELWAKLRALTGAQQSGVEKGTGWTTGEYNLCPEYNGGIILQIFDLPEGCDDEGQAGQSATMADGSWHFIAGTWDGNTIGLYMDGKEINKLECKGEISPNNGPLFIGCRNGAERWANGFMDEIKIYNRALSADELNADMANPAANLSVTTDGKSAITWGKLKTIF
jgi:hypothetical protein